MPPIRWRGRLQFNVVTISWSRPHWIIHRVTSSPTSIDEPDPGHRVYRVFSVSADGRVGDSHILDAQSDDEAKAIAATLPNGHGIDLWERARYLASYPPRSAAYP